jgi:hypothetical protein
MHQLQELLVCHQGDWEMKEVMWTGSLLGFQILKCCELLQMKKVLDKQILE